MSVWIRDKLRASSCWLSRIDRGITGVIDKVGIDRFVGKVIAIVGDQKAEVRCKCAGCIVVEAILCLCAADCQSSSEYGAGVKAHDKDVKRRKLTLDYLLKRTERLMRKVDFRMLQPRRVLWPA